ncbi:MAG TPA: hypothetical protein VFA21_05830 [Pyrinomonadaceae bacterium]|nr:hypothetical protein [Pyrinomonadaceae bacterium]
MKTKRVAQQYRSAALAGRISTRTLIFIAVFALACGEALAQEQQDSAKQHGEELAAPPPMRYLPDDVRKQLEAERDPKARTRLSLELAEQRLDRVAEQANAEHFVAATGELGIYEAIVQDSVHFLQVTNPGHAGNKLRDLCKHLDITLRSHIPRLETIRRELPSQHAVYLRDAIEFVREERDLALNAFYDDTVIAEPRHQGDRPATAERAKGDAPAMPETDKKPQQR